jgi:hypothetical protein
MGAAPWSTLLMLSLVLGAFPLMPSTGCMTWSVLSLPYSSPAGSSLSLKLVHICSCYLLVCFISILASIFLPSPTGHQAFFIVPVVRHLITFINCLLSLPALVSWPEKLSCSTWWFASTVHWCIVSLYLTNIFPLCRHNLTNWPTRFESSTNDLFLWLQVMSYSWSPFSVYMASPISMFACSTFLQLITSFNFE